MRISILFLFLSICPLAWGEKIHPWLIPLRDSVYENVLNIHRIRMLYQTAKNTANDNLEGAELNVALARCEYFMGRAFQLEKLNDSAIHHFGEGLKFAQKAIDLKPSDESWVALGENMAQMCALRSWAYVLVNGLSVGRYSENALKFNNRNARAYFLIASRWVFAPRPFNDIPRGINIMKSILTDSDPDKCDLYNTYYSIGAGYELLKNPSEAILWVNKSLELYPTNKESLELLDRLKGN